MARQLQTRTALLLVVIAIGCKQPAAHPDGGDLDSGAPPDLQGAPGNNEELVRIAFVPFTTTRPATVDGLGALGVGTKLDYVVEGRNSSGRRLPAEGVTFSTTTPNTIRWVEHAGVVSLIGLAPGKAKLVATAPTATGSLSAILELNVAMPESVSLTAWTVQDDSPYQSELDRNGNVPQAPASVAVDIPVRTYVRLAFALLRDDGLSSEGSAMLDPKDLTFSVVSGAATIDGSGVIHTSAVGSVSIEAALTGADLASVDPAKASAAFTSDAPLLGLEVCSVYGDGGYDRCHRSTRAGGSPLVSTLSSDLTTIQVVDGFPAPRALLRASYGGEGVLYHRWIAPSDYTVRTSGDTSAVVIAPDGQTEWHGPGVALWTVTARGFDAPVLMAASYPVGTATKFRFEPSPLQFHGPPSSVVACQRLKGIVTVAGVDREISAFESLAIVRQPDTNMFVGDSMLEHASTGLDFCFPNYVLQVGLASPQLGGIRFWFLPNELQFNEPLTYRVDF